MFRRRIESESGRSKRSVSPLTLLGFVVSDKKSIGAVKERIFNSSQRTYYRSREVWICEECSGVAAHRRMEHEQAEERRLNEIRKHELAAEKEARRVETARLRAEENIAKKIRRSEAFDRTTQEKETLKSLAKAVSDQRATNTKRSKDAMLHFAEMSKLNVTNNLNARNIRIALRKRPLILARALAEAIAIGFVLILIGLFLEISFSKYDLAVKTISLALIGIPIYTVAAYKIRSRKTLLERRRLVQEFLEATENASSKSIGSVETKIITPQPDAVATSAKKSGVTATNVTIKFEISNGDTYETDEIDIPLVLSDDVSAAWLSKLQIELSDDNLCGFMRHLYGNPDYDGSDCIGVGYDLILEKLSQEVYRNRGWLDARATPNGLKIGRKSISIDDDKKESLMTMMIQLSPDGFMYIA